MQKKSFSTNFSSGALTMLDSMAKDLNLSRSSLLESLLISKMGNLYNPTVDEVESLNNGFLLNSLSSVTWDFRKQFSHLSSKARFELIMFFYSINLIKGISVSTNKQANISKNGDLVCYFAVGKIGRWQKDVSTYVSNLKKNFFILGPISAPNDEYIHISDLQQFTIAVQYRHFSKLCKLLGAPAGTNVMKIHYTKLNELIDNLEKI